MMYVFDSSILIDIENKNKKTLNLLNELWQKNSSIPHITFMNYTEILNGIKDKSKENKDIIIDNLNKYPLLHTTDNTPHIISSLKCKYESKGTILPLADLIIASLTIENQMVLITTDKDFEPIKELRKIIL